MERMAESAWLTFHCETGKQARVATFRHTGGEWQLAEVSADALPEGGTIPGRITKTGPFGIASDYTGCPGCGADSYVRCGECGEMCCWRTSTSHHTCPGCGNHGQVSGRIRSAEAMDVA
ncbi:hypothetical protein SAMN05421541_106357 [Actinoplanes philippinensis]|uniref:TerY-C metal binding domain-containing protein n=1 Tax=Actinoplanes philippinensis TaxID=35752 RepID=A0A1I2GAS3_9ACTN|nr:hypothetical protein [Actinoplanes philippinensis]SFF14229.1 hypothetical protein SAMN05421541_106357 [Actinoplanes philippinensis]